MNNLWLLNQHKLLYLLFVRTSIVNALVKNGTSKMREKAQFETFKEISGESGIAVSFRTAPGGYHPLHWHEEVELLYLLNGESTIKISGTTYHMPKKQLIAIDSKQVHSTYCYDETSMYVCIHILKEYLKKWFPMIDFYEICCKPTEITDEVFADYREICSLMEDLTRIYMEDTPSFALEAEGITLQIMGRLLQNFSVNNAKQVVESSDVLTMNRIRDVISYVEEHFREPIPLQDIAGYLGLGREYFCRFFKKNMGISFLEYVNEIRVSHIYYDLVHTDQPISELIEENGFTNQKLFNKTFKRIYGKTPSAIRKGQTLSD